MQIHELYIRVGAEREVALPSRLRKPDSELGGTPDYEALLRLAKKEMLFVLSSDAYPRFCASPVYDVMLKELESRPSERSGVLATTPTEEAEGKPDTGAALRDGDEASPTVAAPPPGGLALPPPVPSTWLTRFIRIADLLPVCITLTDVSDAVPAQIVTSGCTLTGFAPLRQMTQRHSPIIYCNDSESFFVFSDVTSL